MAQYAIDMAKDLGATYVDVRLIRSRQQSIDVKNGRLEGVTNRYGNGIGIRAYIDGAWGFAGNPDLKLKKVEVAVRRAVLIAKASARVKGEGVRLAPVEPAKGSWASPCAESPFDVPLEEKLDILFRCNELMMGVEGVAIAKATMDFREENKLFVSSEGSVIRQRTVQSGAGTSATTVGASGVQTRSFPYSFRGQFENRGFEHVRRLGLVENAERVAREAVELQTAPQCESGITTVILGGNQLALQIHESCGHPTELDRALGTEINFAGGTFMQPELLGNLKYGSEKVTITYDATIEGALGSYGWDDEGVAGQRFTIIDRGRFVEYQTSRETAPILGVRANGTMRADGWNNLPLIRMATVSLEPGDVSYEDLIAGTDDGLLLMDNRSWSIDDMRVNFQFGTELGWRIKKGKLAGMVKNPTYTGTTTEFWNSCDAVADRASWKVIGIPNCGKGQPSQTARVSHGASFARFRNVKVGVGYDK